MIITTVISSMRVKPRSSLTPVVSVTRRTNMRPDALRSASIEPARVSEQADDGALKALAPEGACGFESHPGHVTAWSDRHAGPPRRLTDHPARVRSFCGSIPRPMAAVRSEERRVGKEGRSLRLRE